MAIAADRVKSIFRKTEKELLRLSSGPRAEAVHGFRTTTRRLQTLLEQLPTQGKGDGRHKKLMKMLNRIRKAAGRVRDVDVQLEALRSFKVVHEPRRKTQLMHSLIELRAEHEKRLRKLLKEKRVTEIRRRLKRAAQTVRLEALHDPLPIAREMLGSVTISNRAADDETLHQYRLLVKRTRYAAEFASASSEKTKFLAQLKTLQDALGNWHDWWTLTHTAAERLGDVHESPFVAALHNVTRGKFRNAVAAVTAANSGLDRFGRQTAPQAKKRTFSHHSSSAAA